MSQMSNRHHKLLGLPVWQGNKSTLKNLILSEAEYLELFSINAEICIGQRNNDLWHKILSENKMNLIDGQWAKKILEWKYNERFEKLSGSDLIYDFCELAQRNNKKIFFLGASQQVADKAILNLRDKYTGIPCFSYSPPFEGKSISREVTMIILAKIKEFQPNYLIACLGAPKQEIWLYQNRGSLRKIGVEVVMGAGGSLDFVSGILPRAPLWVQKTGFEWLYRLYKEPWRWRRQLNSIPHFFLLSILDILKYRFLSK